MFCPQKYSDFPEFRGKGLLPFHPHFAFEKGRFAARRAWRAASRRGCAANGATEQPMRLGLVLWRPDHDEVRLVHRVPDADHAILEQARFLRLLASAPLVS